MNNRAAGKVARLFLLLTDLQVRPIKTNDFRLIIPIVLMSSRTI